MVSLKLLRKGYVSGVDEENKIVFVSSQKIYDKALEKMSSLGYTTAYVGRITLISQDQNITPADEYILPYGCSPSLVKDNVLTTAQHCVAVDLNKPALDPRFILMDSKEKVLKEYEASLANYTLLKKCGLWCLIKSFFLDDIEEYINTKEVVQYKGNFDRDQTLLTQYNYIPAGVISFGSETGYLMAFSPIINTTFKKGDKIIYISYDYYEHKYVVTEAYINGYITFWYEKYIFKLPYAYDPGRVIVKPGYSGSIVFLIPQTN